MGFESTSLWAGVISGGMSQVEATRALNSGQLDKQQYAIHTTKNVTGAVGVMAGIEYGAVLGSALIPGVGTVVGSILGGLVGDRLGKYVGTHAGHLVFKGQLAENVPIPMTQNNASMNHATMHHADMQRHAQETATHDEEASYHLH